MYCEIPFPYPFAGYSTLDFINCFTSAYMCMEGYDGTQDCYCGGRLVVCDSCSGCGTSLAKKQEELFFYFGTLTGCNAQRSFFDGSICYLPTDSPETIDFAMRLAGYTYVEITNELLGPIMDSINAGRPVLARMLSQEKGSFRIISGYQGDSLISPTPTGAQRRPEGPPTIEEIESIFVITGKTTPTLGLKEGLEQIVKVMEANQTHKVWDECISHFNYWEDLKEAEFHEIRDRFARISQIMWFTFNCHNFAETFRRELYHKINDKHLRELLYRTIDQAYDSTHTTAWQVIALSQCRDWSNRQYHELEWGMCNNVIQCLERLKENDQRVLEVLRVALTFLQGTQRQQKELA